MGVIDLTDFARMISVPDRAHPAITHRASHLSEPALRATIQTIEDELDPRGTLSPGKQGAWHSIRRVLDTVAHNG
jgi:hypothetical protein